MGTMYVNIQRSLRNRSLNNFKLITFRGCFNSSIDDIGMIVYEFCNIFFPDKIMVILESAMNCIYFM